MFAPRVIFELKIHQNSFAAGALPRTPLGELTAHPRPPSWFSGALGGRGGKRRGGRGGDGRGGSISIPSHNMCYNNLTTVVSKLTSESLFPVIKSLGWEVQGGMGKLCKKKWVCNGAPECKIL